LEILLVLVDERKAIIENRKSDANDAITWKGKEKAWEELAEKFNSMHSNQRTIAQIRHKYEALKKVWIHVGLRPLTRPK